MKKNISVIGLGYVGTSIAVLLARHHKVKAMDICRLRVDAINSRKSPIEDRKISQELATSQLDLTAYLDPSEALAESEVVIIATPTDFDPNKNQFSVSSIDNSIENVLKHNSKAQVFIKSTIPFGYTRQARKKYNKSDIYFSPEFLREGNALHDNLHPSRIVVGDTGKDGRYFSDLMLSAALDDNVPIILTSPEEAEVTKLFANAYLASRVAFFNELDSFTLKNGLNSRKIIEGISKDPRIGEGYNNPSFGYGGYCLPKDTKQLLSQYENIPESLISAIVDSNLKRINLIADDIAVKYPGVIGVYRMSMKAGSDNYRESASQKIVARLVEKERIVKVYEPNIAQKSYCGAQILNNFNEFIARCDVLVCNRIDDKIKDTKLPIYTRDIFGEN